MLLFLGRERNKLEFPQLFPLFDLILFGFVDYRENLDFLDVRLLLFMLTSVIKLETKPIFYEQFRTAVY